MSTLEQISPEGYKKTELGVIPVDWEVAPISKNMKLINGYGFKPHQWSNNGLPIIRIQNLNSVDAMYNYYEGCVDEKFHIKKGDILFAWSGSKGSSFGARVWQGVPAILNQHIFRVVPNQQVLTVKYSFYILRKVQEQIEKMAHGFKSSFVHVKKEDLSSTLLPIPNKNEQVAITSALSDVDALLTELENLIAKKQAIKTATMQQLLTGKTRLPQFATYTEGDKQGQAKGRKPSELGEIPEDWEVVKIGEFTDCTAGGTPSTKVPAYWGGSNPWMSSGELHRKRVFDVAERITDLGLTNSSTKYIPKNSVLIGLAGQGKTRGTVAISKIKLCTNQSIAAIFPSKEHSTDYLFYNLDNRYEELRGLSTGDGGRGGLNLSIIRSLKVPSPNLEEQTAIATILSDMDNDIQTLEQRLAKTRQIKLGMMQELLTGRTRLPFDSKVEEEPEAAHAN